MTGFAIRFLACNLCISVIIVLLFAVKSLLGKRLTSRFQYRLWFPLLGLLAVPFLPLEHIPLPAFPAWLHAWKPQDASAQTPGNLPDSLLSARENTGWMNDFAISASQKAPSVLGAACSIVWICGMAFLLFSFIKSMLHLSDIRQSALPLQNAGVRSLYRRCLLEMHIRRSIPVRSTAFLKSPMISGIFFPCIYLPVSLISDYDADSMPGTGCPGRPVSHPAVYQGYRLRKPGCRKRCCHLLDGCFTENFPCRTGSDAAEIIRQCLRLPARTYRSCQTRHPD